MRENIEHAASIEDRPVALVTGTSSGFGALAARRFARLGYRVIGTSRSRREGATSIDTLELDVDRDASVSACIAEVITRCGRIDVLVNNAGRAMVGAAEETSADEARALFETNFFGAMRVTSAVLPIMRAQRRGHIVNVGSVSGFIGLPFHGIYAASKHALAGYTEALRYEVRPLGIHVSLVEPEAHRTTITMSHPARMLSVYDRGRDGVERTIRSQIDGGDDPDHVAQAIVSLATASAPPFRRRIGSLARLAAWARRFLPSSAFERFLRYQLDLE